MLQSTNSAKLQTLDEVSYKRPDGHLNSIIWASKEFVLKQIWKSEHDKL